MKSKEATIELDCADLDCLETGGSIRYDLEHGTAVVWLSMKNPPRRDRPSIAHDSDNSDPR